MKEKVLIGFISLLFISLLIVNFNFKKEDKSNNKEQVLGIQSLESYSLSKKIDNIPYRNSDYYEPTHIWANSYILLDQDSSTIMAQKNSDSQVPIASTTKIMTAIIALENYDLNEIVTISEKAAYQIGSYSGLNTNERITVKNLLYCLLINSGNDSAYALAEHMGYKKFITKMNEKAKYLGANNTKYFDPAGLDDNGYSTARDLAFLTSYAMRNKLFRNIVSTTETTVYSEDGLYSHQLENSNRLIIPTEPLYYQYAKGVKTGYTPDAGHCLVSSAEKDDHTIISVILYTLEDTAEASAKESNKLLNWGFDNYNWK